MIFLGKHQVLFKTRAFLVGWYLLAMLVLASGIALSFSRFPGEFDWQYRVVSDLSSQIKNPDGNRFFCGALALTCLMLFPCAAFLWRSLWPLKPRLSTFSYWALVTGFSASITVGIERLVFANLSAHIWKAHEYIALVAFTGLFLGVVGFWLALSTSYVRSRGQRPLAGLIAFLISGGPMVGLALSQAYLYFVPNQLGWVGPHWREMGIPLYLSFAFWEWLAAGAVFVYLFLLVLLAPTTSNTISQTAHQRAS